MINGLAGPLHGLANQECLSWLLGVRDQFGGVPMALAVSVTLLFILGVPIFLVVGFWVVGFLAAGLTAIVIALVTIPMYFNRAEERRVANEGISR